MRLLTLLLCLAAVTADAQTITTNGGAISAAQMPALTGDVTSSAGSAATTVAKIAGTVVTTPVGTGAVVLATSPTIATPTLSGITTGTNADFLCLSAGGVVLLQTSACTISSMRFKDIKGPLTGKAMAEVMALHPLTFTMKPGETPNPDPNYGRLQIGLTAENVARVDHRLAIFEDDGVTPKSYRQEAIIALLIKAMQEQQAEISDLKRRMR